jgi:hypothetical protein
LGQGTSRSGIGRGIAGTAAVDGVVAIDCALSGTLPGVGQAQPGAGNLADRADGLIVVDPSGSPIATCDPQQALTARLSGCIRQGFRYAAEVTVDDGAVRIDVHPAP